MKKWIVLPIFFAFLAPCHAAETYTVKQASDGDTIVLDDGRKIRLIGVDTPEMHDAHRNRQSAKRKGLDRKIVQAFAERAKVFTEDAVVGKTVRLEYDWRRKDKYGRTLAYVYRYPDDFFLNAEIIKRGYGFAYTHFPFRYLEDFRRYENQAREKREGLWKR